MIPTFAPIILKKRQRIIDLFRESGAISIESAKSIDEIGLSKNVLLEIQKLRGIIIKVDQNHFYLDETREKRVKQYRKIFAVVSGLLLILIAWYFNKT